MFKVLMRALLLVLALFAAETVAAQDNSAAPAATAPATPHLRVVTRELPPFIIREGEGYSGFSAELWQELATRLGVAFDWLEKKNVKEILQAVEQSEADIGIAPEALDQYAQLITLPVRQWSHCVIAPEGNPILKSVPLSLAELAKWPLITYDTAFTGRSRINRAFERIGVQPNIALTALDADVIKTYVSLGLGLGIISALAFDAQRDAGLVAVDAAHLFESNTTRLALRRGTGVPASAT